MYVDNELVEFMPVDEKEYEEIIKEYKEEILIQEGALEPPATDFADTPPAQGKPRCITLILNKHWISIYLWCVFMLQTFYGNHLHKYICPMSPSSTGASSCYA